MKRRENTRKFQKQNFSMNKLAILLFICIIIITILEALGITNRLTEIEKSSENTLKFNFKRAITEKTHSNSHDQQIKRENILYNGAIDQFIYENDIEEIFESSNDFYYEVHISGKESCLFDFIDI
jgi:cell division protein FtsL